AGVATAGGGTRGISALGIRAGSALPGGRTADRRPSGIATLAVSGSGVAALTAVAGSSIAAGGVATAGIAAGRIATDGSRAVGAGTTGAGRSISAVRGGNRHKRSIVSRGCRKKVAIDAVDASDILALTRRLAGGIPAGDRTTLSGTAVCSA